MPRPLYAGAVGRCLFVHAAAIRPWLVTSERIVGRLWDDRLYGWRWKSITGFRATLEPGREIVALDHYDGSQLQWAGAGVAPIAIAATARLHGAQALVYHPALRSLRCERTG
jgi:hypothetical protein